MSIYVPKDLPAIAMLQAEDVEIKARCGDGKIGNDPTRLQILVLNIMPIKETTERDFCRILSASPHHIDITWMMLRTHQSKNTSQTHINQFYSTLEDVKDKKFDGMIITGAPVELYEYEEVRYWPEMTTIFDWAHKNIKSTLYICWGAQAALWHFHKIRKRELSEKMFGVFAHTIAKDDALLKGLTNGFYVPHSRHTELVSEDIAKEPQLVVLAISSYSGIGIIASTTNNDYYLTGHSEYSPSTLHDEYMRDKNKGLDIALPQNYYINNNPENEPLMQWQSDARSIFANWTQLINQL